MAKRNDFQGEIEQVAYDLYMQRGMVNGHDLDDWFQAVKIVEAKHASSRKSETEAIIMPKRKERLLKKEKTA